MKKTKPNKDNPSFCIITPTSYLEDVASRSNTHLVLAHLVESDNDYRTFYKDRSSKGDYIICDNSAFEFGEPYHPDRLIDVAQQVGADAIVLPDYPGQPSKKTIEAALKYAQQVKNVGLETFFVPQSSVGDLEDWVDAYQFAASNDLIDIIGMSILGMPNAIPHIPMCYARVVLTSILVDRGIFAYDKYHHYLGSNAGLKLEVPPLIKMKVMDSLDSSNPVWHAILGHEYSHNTDSFLSVKKSHFPVQFDIPFDSKVIDRVQHNVNLSLELFNVHQS
jgi:hypothetical protein